MHSCFFFRKVTLSQQHFPYAFLEFPKVSPQTSKENYSCFPVTDAHYRGPTNFDTFFFLKKSDFA